MRSLKKIKVRLKYSDKWRTLLTDTAPFEVPIIFSNDGFYKNISKIEERSDIFKNFINVLVVSQRNYTIPLKYSIIKSKDSVRTLSLIHPHGQVSLAEFYKDYDQLICEYASRSPFSIRKPSKIGTSYFYNSPIADKNKYKNATVNIAEIDNLVRNPASYFSYYGFDRLYLFFLSDDYVRLEKKYKYQYFLDIGKCFDSIYTHSIAWATKTKELAKESIKAWSFGNKFDETMQKLNYNETNGICIGPEASRIFAEIILAKIDLNVVKRLLSLQRPLRLKEDYECRRYVDNYYIFANSEDVLFVFKHELSLALREYNLHLHEGKTEKIHRPFYTRKSLIIDKVNLSIKKLWEKTLKLDPDLDTRYFEGRKLEFPRHIYRHRALFGDFTREVKAACFASDMGYDAVSNYIIGAVRNKLVQLADTYEKAHDSNSKYFVREHYRENMLFLLDVGFYFFTLHPTVASSLRLSHTIVRATQHMENHDEEGFEIVREAVLRWTFLLAQSPIFSKLYERSAVVPIEILNILLSLRQLSGDGTLEAEILDKMNLENGESSYFQIIVRLFIYSNHTVLEERKAEIFQQACERILASSNLTQNSELSHLLLDLLACPFIVSSERKKLLMDVWPILQSSCGSLDNINDSQAEQLVGEIEQQHWFVGWEGINLLNMIEKKELSAVYA